jgi:hypothetical protein
MDLQTAVTVPTRPPGHFKCAPPGLFAVGPPRAESESARASNWRPTLTQTNWRVGYRYGGLARGPDGASIMPAFPGSFQMSAFLNCLSTR